MDVDKAKETASSIKDDTAKFAKQLGNDIGTTWEEPLGFSFQESRGGGGGLSVVHPREELC